MLQIKCPIFSDRSKKNPAEDSRVLEDVAMWLVVSVLVSKLEKHRHRATLTRDDEIDTAYLDNAMLDMQSGLLLTILALNLYFWVFTHVHLHIEMIAQTKKHSHRVPLL